VSSLTNPEYNITTETPHANSVDAYDTSDSSDHIALLQLVGHPKGTIVFSFQIAHPDTPYTAAV
jgi:hypothetical protein